VTAGSVWGSVVVGMHIDSGTRIAAHAVRRRPSARWPRASKVLTILRSVACLKISGTSDQGGLNHTCKQAEHDQLQRRKRLWLTLRTQAGELRFRNCDHVNTFFVDLPDREDLKQGLVKKNGRLCCGSTSAFPKAMQRRKIGHEPRKESL
jgi:hypothetical protein